jgi:hypothetical protein
MAKHFGFTNVGENSNATVTPGDLKPVTNYACIEDEATVCRLTNVTCPLDQPEVLTYGCQDISNVNTSIKNQYPPSTRDGIQYTVKVETLLSVESDTTDSRVDYPIVAQLNIRHPKAGSITADDVMTVTDRVIGAIYSSEGKSRLTNIMRQSLRPSED